MPEVDDPKARDPDAEPARQLVSVPVFALADASDADLGSLPRAII